MNLIQILLPFSNNEKNNNLVIGHFDVVHKGHYQLFKKLNNFSFLIFDNNPSKNKSLYSLNERIDNLKKFNPQNIYVYDISSNNLSDEQFIDEVLKKISFNKIIVGSDFRFGKNRTGDINKLKSLFNVDVVNNDNKISTSLICSFLEKGDIQKANDLLTSFFYYKNVVIKGKQLARQLFNPTANIIDNKSVILPFGSYASIVEYNNKLYKGLSFIGIPKMFEQKDRIVETYIFDFNEEIYGQEIKVYPLTFIRPNQKFNNLDELKLAIANDYKNSLIYFDNFNFDKFIS